MTWTSAIIYAWIMYHPAGAVPISGSNRLDRLDTAIKALDIRLGTMNGTKYIRPAASRQSDKTTGRRDC